MIVVVLMRFIRHKQPKIRAISLTWLTCIEAVGTPPPKLSMVYVLIGPTICGGLVGMSLIINLGFTISLKAGRLIDAGRGSGIITRGAPLRRRLGEGGGDGEGVEVTECVGVPGWEWTGEGEGERDLGVYESSLSVEFEGER